MLTAVVLAACSGPLGGTPVATRYYVMGTAAPPTEADAEAAKSGPVVGVAPVVLPEYLNNPGIVTRDKNNEIVRAEFDQWAGPLGDEIARAVAENLSVMVPTDRVTVAVGRGILVPLDDLIEIEIAAFERDGSGAVHLVTRWSLFRDSGQTLVTMRRSRFQKAAATVAYGDTVATMSQIVEELSREIAETIRLTARGAPSS